MTNIEQIRAGAMPPARAGLFSISMARSPLIRSGWVDVMVPMMVEILLDLKTGETEAELRRYRRGLRRGG